MTAEFNNNAPGYRRSRILYIIEAAVEYFISILMGNAYLARISLAIGLTDAQAAIMTSLTSFACVFQLLALLINSKYSTKSWVIPCHVVNQLLFTFVYLVPVIELPEGTKPFFLIVPFIVGSLLHNIVQSPKLSWMMSFVGEHYRGSYTALKEMVSLISGMIFTYIMGTVIDGYDVVGDSTGSFITCGITVLGLMIIHTALLFGTKAQSHENTAVKVSLLKQLRGVITDKNILLVIPVAILYYIGTGVANPFFNTYTMSELGFSMSYISILSAVSAIARSVVSLPFGMLADRISFTKMLTICYGIMTLAYVVNMFTTPENGTVMYAIYSALTGIANGGVISGLINLLYDHTPVEKRTGAYAIQNTVCGLVGFVATLAVSPFVDFMQANGNTLFGHTVYAQQVLSGVAAVIFIIVIIYLNTVVKLAKRIHD